ncbi:hypothetical protein [Sulfitobacter donghicola]|uniref:FlgN-like protein n=1 Tax=Sulfitobacter donghicola DSW-25 = KCTC 12864 = JCM 14565 TaxID=1300350 RepID=A0A073IM62_9RHOB|nr:hypothetical protein [Sulfitobacter donghicola]KEJ90561.1 FlgN-like protein [Sulfitobacter donghicola DSW-25 = KCTC 12864 = JCM 14565]KIN67807.1 FlgN-like protein [Sulfitobacter donghicola DSW-25 = KCTC 12864 = JCM 14565]
MTTENPDFESLDSLLEKERKYLLEGDLQGLSTLLAEKESILDAMFESEELNRKKIGPLERKLQRNQLLLDGALEGIRSVSVRLAALRQVRSALDTYDERGCRQSVPTNAKQQVEKRA